MTGKAHSKSHQFDKTLLWGHEINHVLLDMDGTLNDFNELLE